jgi:hypothetical protein
MYDTRYWRNVLGYVERDPIQSLDSMNLVATALIDCSEGTRIYGNALLIGYNYQLRAFMSVQDGAVRHAAEAYRHLSTTD